MPRFHRNVFFGIVLHGDKLWFSELLGISFVAILCVAFLSISAIILQNYLVLTSQAKDIALLRNAKVRHAYQLDEMREEDRLVRSLHSIVGNRLSADQMYHLVGLVYENSRRFGYDPLLVLAVIHVESVFRAGALGQYQSGNLSGAFGLMQIKLETARQIAHTLDIELTNDKDLLRPEINIQLGIAYLTQQITLFKSFKLGLIAYNLGPGVVIQNIVEKKPLPIDYYNKILRSYFRLKQSADAISG
jgi:soluble lytic murein transglycosylase-like protein